MAETGNICIFRDGVETSATEKVDFDGDSATPDAKSHIETYNMTMTLVTQENPVPDSNNPSGLQDTGLAIVQYEITGFFDGTGGTPLGIAQFVDWMREDKTSSSFPLADDFLLQRVGFKAQIVIDIFGLLRRVYAGASKEYFNIRE